MKFRHASWGDNDRYFGPFTWSPRCPRCSYTAMSVILSSGGDGDDSDRPCTLRFSAAGYTLIAVLPQIIKPHKEKVVPNWDAATVARLGRDYYWDVTPCEYGFSYSDGHLHFKLGRQTNDSSTTKDWGCFLPWTQWRHVRKSYYGLKGELFVTEAKAEHRLGELGWRDSWEARKAAEDSCPSLSFDFDDFDGERISVKTRIYELEWKFGTGYFKWLSMFRASKINRSLDLQFSKETGRRKGSWKGGTTGHSIDMLPGEFHEAAFRRYCEAHEMKFIGAVTA